MRDNLENCLFSLHFVFFPYRLVTLFTACSTAPIALFIVKFLRTIRPGVNLTQVSTGDNHRPSSIKYYQIGPDKLNTALASNAGLRFP